jgi:hypothetical protein
VVGGGGDGGAEDAAGAEEVEQGSVALLVRDTVGCTRQCDRALTMLVRDIALYYIRILFIPEALTYSVHRFLKRQCDRILGGAWLHAHAARGMGCSYFSSTDVSMSCVQLAIMIARCYDKP